MKTRIIAAIILGAVGLMSCEDDARTLRVETTEDVCWYSGEFSIGHWTKVSDRNGLNSYYKADVRLNNMNYDVISGGLVNCYLFVDADVQAPLPCVRHYENAEGQMWTRTIDYEYYYGGLTVYVTDSDFAGENPGPMSFRIMLSW